MSVFSVYVCCMNTFISKTERIILRGTEEALSNLRGNTAQRVRTVQSPEDTDKHRYQISQTQTINFHHGIQHPIKTKEKKSLDKGSYRLTVTLTLLCTAVICY